MKVEDLVFGTKKRKRKLQPFGSTASTFESEVFSVDPDDARVGEIEAGRSLENVRECSIVNDQAKDDKNLQKLMREEKNLKDSVKKLTKDMSKPMDHKALLEDSARKLNELRLKTLDQKEICPNIAELKASLESCRSEEELANAVWSSPTLQKRLQGLLRSRFLEQVLALGLKKENPLSNFPPDLNKNLYKEVIDFALLHSEDLLLTLLNLTVKNETPVLAKDVVQLAYLFATLAEFVSSSNNVMKKTKSLSQKSCGLTNLGLDSQAVVGASVTSRVYRNDRDSLAGYAEEVAKQYAKIGTVQFTFDNMDLMINHTMHHFTLNIMEFENFDTSNLKTDSMEKSDILQLFNLETVLLEKDKPLLDHYNFVTVLTLGRFLGKEVPGWQWLLEVLPKHYDHPNSDTAGNKSLLHVSKPLYYQETVNDDMNKIMSSLQLEYLTLVGEQAANKVFYLNNLKKMLSVECSEEEREAAEAEVKKQVLLTGVLICHGDQLTNERFESCKRLAQGSASAFERFEFMPIF